MRPGLCHLSLCAPPPGATRVGGERGELGRDSPHRRDPLGTFSGRPVARVSEALQGCGL